MSTEMEKTRVQKRQLEEAIVHSQQAEAKQLKCAAAVPVCQNMKSSNCAIWGAFVHCIGDVPNGFFLQL